jgi:hypothetical protein
MWAMLNGSFLRSRGAVHGTSAESGSSEQQNRRSWQALRCGDWSIDELILYWRELVFEVGGWQANDNPIWAIVGPILAHIVKVRSSKALVWTGTLACSRQAVSGN